MGAGPPPLQRMRSNAEGAVVAAVWDDSISKQTRKAVLTVLTRLEFSWFPLCLPFPPPPALALLPSLVRSYQFDSSPTTVPPLLLLSLLLSFSPLAAPSSLYLSFFLPLRCLCPGKLLSPSQAFRCARAGPSSPKEVSLALGSARRPRSGSGRWRSPCVRSFHFSFLFLHGADPK